MKSQPHNPQYQAQSLDARLFASLDKAGELIRALQWEQAKAHKVSPLQLQVLLFLCYHDAPLRKAAQLAAEFSVTRATISDTIKSLLSKGLILKEPDPEDSRSSFLHLSAKGEGLVREVEGFPEPVLESLQGLPEADKGVILAALLKVLYQAFEKGLIKPQRMCFACRHYEGDREERHRCGLLKVALQPAALRLDCPEHETRGKQIIN